MFLPNTARVLAKAAEHLIEEAVEAVEDEASVIEAACRRGSGFLDQAEADLAVTKEEAEKAIEAAADAVEHRACRA